MDIQSLIRGVLPTMEANATATAAAGNASSTQHFQLESLLPMLGLRSLLPMYGLVGTWLGIDPTFILTAFGAVWALNKVARQIYGTAFAVTSEYLMSTIHISSNDDMYMHLMRWLAAQPKMTSSRSLTAETVSKTAWEDEDDSNVSRDKSGVYLNFSNQEAKAPPRFVPAVGLHSFWWGGTYFRLHRKQESVFDDGASSGFSTFKDREDLVISCLGRNPEPIKSLLKHVKESYYNNHHARTIVKRPSPMNLRRYGGRHCWQQVADRPIRDMRTVVLDNHQKMQVLADINEYLHPATPRWYANRGIPLRRGYLFHGPPGTGKTSLSFALAGVFGLDIYVISLLEPTLTEEDLGALFSSLPRRCVVLLEDIDTAGLRRPAEELKKAEAEKEADGGDKENSKDKEAASNDWKVSDLAKALKKESNNDDKKGISLSGLLNAIDGVASHEGRVLIMTTNVPESLDEALIRPGRVDLQVGFTNATREQARELFIRMYEADQGRRQQASDNGAATKTNGAAVVAANGKDPAKETKRGEDGGQAVAPETQSAMNSGDMDISVEELPEIAEQFAAKIPETKFSPAEIQGYLLKRKKHPLKAVEETDKWVDAMVQQKASKSKVLQVQ
ncbi:mitochondrial chaperone BCS1-B [Apiospora rasikravindrae]|uniref:Mitochondrial chaperone BCS1-B n=1 Tax=Apiospora rasikravindrae TaxID=990691 RepID=A0ABR1SL42_9PEZI